MPVVFMHKQRFHRRDAKFAKKIIVRRLLSPLQDQPADGIVLSLAGA
jgi:hypothetical protein